jgi:hypothetical protein
VAKRRLPVGIQTFRIIREEGFYYVDKTGYIRRLLDDDGTHYFLSRPRRFGKSLFVDTLKEFFEGSEKLFRGLAVHEGWDWSRRHPVVRLSFGGGNYSRPGQLLARMAEQLADLEREAGVPASEGATPSGRFARLLAALHRQSGRRVVVLVDEYDKPILDAVDDTETARVNRDDLRGLYGTIKDCDAHIELTFITGVAPEALLFQTGYLTIAEADEDDDGLPEYRLSYPNREVRRGLNRALLDALAPNWRRTTRSGGTLRRLLAAQDWAGMEKLFRALLAGIPHDWHRRNDIARYEGYWASVFYAWFQASMDGVIVEDATSRGRLDMAVLLEGNAYLFEFKVAERSEKGAALAQLKERGYADKHRAPGRAVHLIGVEISAESRDIASFKTEPA